MALVLFVYWPTLGNGFIWDDDYYVQNNGTLRSTQGLADIWFKLGATPQYYPLVHSTFWMEYHLWEINPRGYHIVNLCLHALSALLVWRLLTVLKVPGAWFAAALFAVHPVEVESVAWITERKNVLSCVLALAALLAYFRYRPAELEDGTQPSAKSAHPIRSYWLALAFYIAALLSKTVTVSVPAVLLVIYWWKRGSLTWRDFLPLAPFFAVGLSLAFVTAWMERTMVGASGAEWDLSPAERILIAGRALWFYAGKLTWPYPIIFFYPRWVLDAGQIWQWLYPVAAVAVMVGLFLARDRIGRGPLAAVLIFAGVLTPALGFFNVFPFRFSFVADHFQYHASIALLALISAMLTVAISRRGATALWAPRLAGGAILLVLAGFACRQTFAYHGLVSLYEDIIAKNPTSWAAYSNLGAHLRHQGEHERALGYFRQGLEIAPDRALMHYNMGRSLAALGRLDEALVEYDLALTGELVDHERAMTFAYSGAALAQLGRYDEAIAQQEKATKLDPTNADALYYHGVALAAQGNLPAGIAKVRAALAIQPNFGTAQHELGAMLSAAGKTGDAVEPFQLAVAIEPQNAKFREDLATVLLQIGQPGAAEPHLRVAARLNPRSADAAALLGVVEESRGNPQAAAAHFQAALAINPTQSIALAGLKRLQSAPTQGGVERRGP